MNFSTTNSLLAYVDDMAIIGSFADKVNKVLKEVSTKFVIRDLGLLHYFLGVDIRRKNNILLLDQQQYLVDLLYNTNFDNLRPSATSMDANFYLLSDEQSIDNGAE